MELREEALKQLQKFSEQHLASYAAKRNFDYGPKLRTNTSVLSKYISHRIIDELTVLRSAYGTYPFARIEKFIQEIMWRTYWKGWLEQRPQVWQDYVTDLTKLQSQTQSEQYQQAIQAATSIPCFNDWVKELQTHGYLHNHARMWFASIWIFTLQLPWQLGADFFLKHLLDGDAAANTLSWRWVAGLHTKGKHYLATTKNINLFSGTTYSNLHLNETAMPCIEQKQYPITPLSFTSPSFDNALCLFHYLDCSFAGQSPFVSNSMQVAVLDCVPHLHSLQYANPVLDFKQKIQSQLQQHLATILRRDVPSISREQLANFVKKNNITKIIIPYLTTGYERDLVENIKKEMKEVTIEYAVRDYDKYCWPFASKGFFAFKDQIPGIIAKFM